MSDSSDHESTKTKFLKHASNKRRFMEVLAPSAKESNNDDSSDSDSLWDNTTDMFANTKPEADDVTLLPIGQPDPDPEVVRSTRYDALKEYCKKHLNIRNRHEAKERIQHLKSQLEKYFLLPKGHRPRNQSYIRFLNHNKDGEVYLTRGGSVFCTQNNICCVSPINNERSEAQTDGKRQKGVYGSPMKKKQTIQASSDKPNDTRPFFLNLETHVCFVYMTNETKVQQEMTRVSQTLQEAMKDTTPSQKRSQGHK